jgi:hypothetical protein
MAKMGVFTPFVVYAGLGINPTFIIMSKPPVSRLQWLSGLLKSLWTFFPALLFIVLVLFCFWLVNQGQDILVAYMEKHQHHGFAGGFVRIVFFVVIALWVYVTWYSSRIIAYIKENQQRETVEIQPYFLDNFPRIAGNACLLVMELAIVQLPVFSKPLGSGLSFGIFGVLVLLLFWLDWRIRVKWSAAPKFETIFWTVLVILILLIIASAFPVESTAVNSVFALLVLLVLHVVYLLYINLRRVKIDRDRFAVRLRVEQEDAGRRSRMERVMDYFCIPRVESGYFSYFLGLILIGFIIDWLAILFLPVARSVTPLPMVVLGFTMLLMLGNTITAFSVRYRVNFHFIIFLLAMVISQKENHAVRTREVKDNGYMQRPGLQAYFTEWLNERVPQNDTTTGTYNAYLVLSNGGASRSGLWTAAVLGRFEDASLAKQDSDRFSDHLLCLSGTSGGGVGVATFFSMLRDRQSPANLSFEATASNYLSQDYFTYTLARMLGPDYFHYIFPTGLVKDRGRALEYSMEVSSRQKDSGFYPVPLADDLSTFTALENHKVKLPILFVNTTRMQDGNPGVVSNLKLDAGIFNGRIDVVALLGRDSDISLASGSVLGGRFPYLSPGGRIGNSYFVDGGYFDNSGAGVVQEFMQGMLDIVRRDSLQRGTLWKQFHKLRFHVLHIINSPVGGGEAVFSKVAPLKNDLLSPLFAIVGAYDMQTTVNDDRLIHYISDIDSFSGVPADYHQISLYKTPAEIKTGDPDEPPYPMNWFMSDTTHQRIWRRLSSEPTLDNLIHSWYPQ